MLHMKCTVVISIDASWSASVTVIYVETFMPRVLLPLAMISSTVRLAEIVEPTCNAKKTE